MPCPHGVDIPQNFRLLNQANFFGMVESGRQTFQHMRTANNGDTSALACKQCGRCLPKCPSDIAIIEQLVQTADLLAQD